MLVRVSDEVFTRASEALELIALFEHAQRGVHRIELAPRRDSNFETWLAEQSSSVRERCELALATSDEAQCRRPARRVIHIVSTATDWSANPPVATLSDAVVLLRRPFSVLVENWETDFAFLCAVAEPEQRAALLRRKADGSLLVENGGGIQDMKKRVLEKKRDPVERLRCWVLFDSDARGPGKPSPDATKLRGACGQHIAHHVLQRRTIENYVTRPALESWADAKNIRHRADAFYKMPTEEHRHFFPMKHGLARDRKGAQGVTEELYGALDPSVQASLAHGFGPMLREVFKDGRVRQADLLAEGAFQETNAAVRELLAWMD